MISTPNITQVVVNVADYSVVVICNENNTEFIASNYIPDVPIRLYSIISSDKLPKQILYVERGHNSVFSKNIVDISTIGSDNYLVLVVDYSPTIFSNLGIIYDFDDLAIQLEIADKYCLDINDGVAKFIKNNLYYGMKEWWTSVIKEIKKGNPLEPVQKSNSEDTHVDDDNDYVNGSSDWKCAYKYAKYNLLYKGKCSLEIFPKRQYLLAISYTCMFRQYKYCLYLVSYAALHPDMCHYVFEKEIQDLFLENNIDKRMLYDICSVAINILYLHDLEIYTKSVKNDNHVLKNMETLQMMKDYDPVMYRNPFKVLIYDGKRRENVSLKDGKTCFTYPKQINIDLFKRNINMLSNGVLNDDFKWDTFMLTGSAIFMSLVYRGPELWNAVSDLDIVCTRKDLTLEEMRELVEEHIVKRLPFVDMKTKIIEGKKTKRVRVYQEPAIDNVKEIDIYFNSAGDISRYHSGPTNGFFDGKHIHGYPRFWCSMYTRSMPNLLGMKCDDPVLLRNKYMEKCGISCDVANPQQLIKNINRVSYMNSRRQFVNKFNVSHTISPNQLQNVVEYIFEDMNVL
jgi:hypothetical protein